MNETVGARTVSVRLVALAASAFACLALAMALVPTQAWADTEVAIPTAKTGLAYTGGSQLLVPGETGVVLSSSNPACTCDSSGAYATAAGTYSVVASVGTGYTWKGGGKTDQTYTVSISKIELSKCTITIKDVKYTGAAQTPVVTVKYGELALTQGTDYDVTYNYNTEVGKAEVIVNAISTGNCNGQATQNFWIYTSQQMYRLYNPNSGEHFYTASTVERDHLVSVGWNSEGTAWYSPTHSTAPVYRLYNPNAGDHHYTTSAVERDSLIDAGWNDEGIGWYSDNNDETVDVLREYNPNATAGAHNFTTNKAEHDNLVSLGWNDEGTAWFAMAAAS